MQTCVIHNVSVWYMQGDPPIVIKFWLSNSLLRTKQEIILTKCCANKSSQTIKHCNWPIETHYFRTPITLLPEFFTKIHFRSVEKYSQLAKKQTVTKPTWSWKHYSKRIFNCKYHKLNPKRRHFFSYVWKIQTHGKFRSLNFNFSFLFVAKNTLNCDNLNKIFIFSIFLTHPVEDSAGSNIISTSKLNSLIVYYVPRRIMRVIMRRATMLAGDRSQGVAEAKPRQSRDESEARSFLRAF